MAQIILFDHEIFEYLFMMWYYAEIFAAWYFVCLQAHASSAFLTFISIVLGIGVIVHFLQFVLVSKWNALGWIQGISLLSVGLALLVFLCSYPLPFLRRCGILVLLILIYAAKYLLFFVDGFITTLQDQIGRLLASSTPSPVSYRPKSEILKPSISPKRKDISVLRAQTDYYNSRNFPITRK